MDTWGAGLALALDGRKRMTEAPAAWEWEPGLKVRAHPGALGESQKGDAMFKFQLGSVLKDKITGFEGVAVARDEWLTGCVRYGLQATKLKDGKPLNVQWLDEINLVVVEAAEKSLAPPYRAGGPHPATPRPCS